MMPMAIRRNKLQSNLYNLYSRKRVMPLLLYRLMTPCCFFATWGLLLGNPRSNYFDLLAIRLIEYSLPYYFELIV